MTDLALPADLIAEHQLRPPSPTVTVADVARATGMSESAIYEHVRRGEIPNVAIGRRVLIPRVWLVQHLAPTGLKAPARIEVIEERVFT